MNSFILFLIFDHLDQVGSSGKPRMTIFQFILMLIVGPPLLGIVLLGFLIIFYGSWQDLLTYMLLLATVIGFRYGLSLLKGVLVSKR